MVAYPPDCFLIHLRCMWCFVVRADVDRPMLSLRERTVNLRGEPGECCVMLRALPCASSHLSPAAACLPCADSSNHVDIMGNCEVISDIIKIATTPGRPADVGFSARCFFALPQLPSGALHSHG